MDSLAPNVPAAAQDKIIYFDRATGNFNEERVFGEAGVKFLYETAPGYLLERTLLSKRPLSLVYGLYNDSRLSARRVASFVRNYNIDLDQFEVPEQGFKSFNEFFIRRYKPGIRPYPIESRVFGSPAEGRVLAYENIDSNSFFPIKNQSLQVGQLLWSPELAREYHGGVGVIIRLCPTDYHRFHFPDDGVVSAARRISGALHSVNPKAIYRRPTLFQENERQRTLIDSKNFGTIAYLEVGALCVGRIVQTYNPGQTVKRGDEKGYFCFGASTVVFFLRPGMLKLDRDLVENTAKGHETFIKLGERLGERV